MEQWLRRYLLCPACSSQGFSLWARALRPDWPGMRCRTCGAIFRRNMTLSLVLWILFLPVFALAAVAAIETSFLWTLAALLVLFAFAIAQNLLLPLVPRK